MSYQHITFLWDNFEYLSFDFHSILWNYPLKSNRIYSSSYQMEYNKKF